MITASVKDLDEHIALLNDEAMKLSAMGRSWAEAKAGHFKRIAEVLRQVRQEKQMTGIGGKTIS